MTKLEIMNKIQKELNGNSFYETKKGNYKIKDIFGETNYFSKKQFDKLYEKAKSHNFYGVSINL